jgi:glycosyltransferase involved in cell wall biosynthesis
LNEIKAAPFVEWTEGVLDDPGLAEWFGRLSCYVYPSSAEGWSFTPREAMYLGIPTALTAIPVHEELVHSGFCTVIPTAGLENAAFEGGTFGQWHRVRVEDIQQGIGEIYRQGGTALDQARKGAQWIENKWQNAEMQCHLIDLLQRFRR